MPKVYKVLPNGVTLIRPETKGLDSNDPRIDQNRCDRGQVAARDALRRGCRPEPGSAGFGVRFSGAEVLSELDDEIPPPSLAVC